ncbi:ABC transporter permease [Paenibacillus sophorae]|uniref:ABC transporter permease n=2 Tax=Paenibacillus sophorae TaxID=1333845 RepID=A0ABX8HEA1_9BACL|nr:ABC transporter permease [Paenibacillus sophorae]QWU16605.1 ABC transporter permease [Paenibacillus sophorae]
MMSRLLAADWLKIRGKGLWLLVLVGPLGVTALQALNFGLRFDYMKQRYAGDLWGGLLDNTVQFVPVALFLGGTLVCSLMSNIEHQTSAWKQLLALPVSRIAVFASKLLLCLLLLAVSCLLLSGFVTALGLIFGFGASEIPVYDILRIGFLSCAAVMPFIALQLWLSLAFRNQALPVSIGVICAIVSPFTTTLSEWLPINWPYLAWSGPHRLYFAGAGLALGLLVLLPGAAHFARKDVS